MSGWQDGYIELGRWRGGSVVNFSHLNIERLYSSPLETCCEWVNITRGIAGVNIWCVDRRLTLVIFAIGLISLLEQRPVIV